MAPELFDRVEYSMKADVWSLGVILYNLCTGKSITEDGFFISREIKQEGKVDLPDFYSKDLNTFLNWILKIAPEQRPRVKDILKHPIFRRLNNIHCLNKNQVH